MQSQDIGSTDFSRKTTLTVLDEAAVLIPEGLSLDKASGDVNLLGIPKPNAAPGLSNLGAGSVVGIVQYSVAFKNSLTGEFGEGTAPAAIDAGAGSEIRLDLSTITNEADHSLVDTIMIFRTAAGGTIAFLVDEVPVATAAYDDDNSDAAISTNRTLPVGTQAYLEYVQDSHGWAFSDGARIYAGGAADYYDDASPYKSQVHWSEVDVLDGPFPNAWPSINFLDTLRDEHLRSGLSLGDFKAIFGENDIAVWTHISNPNGLPNIGDGRFEWMDTGRGAVTFKSVVNVDGMPIVLDRKGIYIWTGGQLTRDISEPIQRVFDRINWNEVAQIHGGYDDNRVYFFVPLDDGIECNYCLLLDRKSFQNQQGIRWWLYKMPMAVRDCTQGAQGPSDQAKLFGHANKKFLWVMTKWGEFVIDQRALSDGAHPEITLEGLSGPASDQVFTPPDGDYQTTLVDLAGTYVKFEHQEHPTPYLISESDDTTFTLLEALQENIPEDTPFKIGAIETLAVFGQADAGDPQVIKHFERVNLMFAPTPVEGAEIRVSTRHDRKGTFVASADKAVDSKFSTDAYERGHRVKTGGRHRSSNADGYVSVPVHGDKARQIQLILEEGGFKPWQLVGYYFQLMPRISEK